MSVTRLFPVLLLIGNLLYLKHVECRLSKQPARNVGRYGSSVRSSNANFRRRYSQGYSSDACVDRNSQCSAWTRKGDCLANSVFMFVNCRKSCSLCSQQAVSAIFSQEKRLKSTLLSGYDPSSRPVQNFTENIDVSLSFSLLHLQSVDEVKQSFTVQGHLKLKWRDPRLTWDPVVFSEIPLISMPVNKLWHPGITVVNTAIASDQFLLAGNPTPVMIRSTGVVVWTPRVEITALCNIDVTNFPVDVHKCGIIFGPWLQDSSSVNISIWDLDDDGEDYNGLLNVLPNQKWSVLDSDLRFDEDYFNPCCSEPWPVIHAEFELQRHVPGLTAGIITPLVYIMITLLAPFLLPIRSLLRFVFASGDCGILLFLLLHLSRVVPDAALRTPLIVQLTVALIMENLLILLICVSLYHMSSPHRRTSFKLPSYSFKWIFLKKLIACIPKKVPSPRKGSVYNRLQEPKQDLVDMLLAVHPGEDTVASAEHKGESGNYMEENNGHSTAENAANARSGPQNSATKDSIGNSVDFVKMSNYIALVSFALVFIIQGCVIFTL